MEYIIQALGVSKKYDNHQALTNVSVSIPAASIFGLLGPNGAGKTTLIRIINQIIAPDEGNLFFNGNKLKADDIKKIGYLPEERGLYKKMKLGEQAIYLAQLKGVKPYDAKKQLKYWFEKFDLTPWWDRKVEELSKGMQQKMQFIITVLHKPDLLIFDEPFSGFDPINVNLLKDEIIRLKEQGTSIIFSTHNMSSVEELCSHIALINKSEKILDGKVDEIRKSYSIRNYTISLRNNQMASIETLVKPIASLVKEEKKSEGITEIKVQINDSFSANELLSHIIPNCEVHGLREELPTMNDIFIKTVTGTYPTSALTGQS